MQHINCFAWLKNVNESFKVNSTNRQEYTANTKDFSHCNVNAQKV